MAEDGWRGALAPDPARMAALRATLDGGGGDFGAALRTAVEDGRARLARAAVSDDLAACAGLIARLRADVTALAPAALTPRRGLAGLFDSRGRRLKRFRAAFRGRTEGMAAIVDDLRARLGRLGQRHPELEALWGDGRAALSEAAAHGAALETWLADRTGPAETDAAVTSLRDHAVALRDAARRTLDRLPLTRALQNADAHVLDGAASIADAADDWRAAWTAGLGLDTRRPRRARPDPQDLEAHTVRLTGALDAADRALAEGRRRRAEIAARLG